jgi:hypothetical protein
MPKKKTPKPTPTDLLLIHPSLHELVVPADTLTLDPANARMGWDIAGIAASIEKYTQRTPLVANKKEGNIILKGNGTYQAMVDILHSRFVACIFVEDSAGAADGYALADNRLTDLSFFDPDVVVQTLLASDEEIPGMETWTEILRELADEVPDDMDIEIPDEELPELEKVPVTLLLPTADYEKYLDAKQRIGFRKSDEEVIMFLVLSYLGAS